jgi:hypothetical protein
MLVTRHWGVGEGPRTCFLRVCPGPPAGSEEILTDNQGRRFEQLVGKNPVPWSVDPDGVEHVLKDSSSRMLDCQ